MIDGRSVLKPGQLDILELLYKYRFGSRQLLADSLGIKAGSSLHEKIQVLIKHGYIGVRLEKRLKLYGIPAAYYLTPKGLRTLAALPNHEYITDSVIKGIYRDKNVSQTFVTQNLCVYSQTNYLKHFYPNLKVFLKHDMSRFSYFPKILPDAFLSFLVSGDMPPLRFFLDIVSASFSSRLLYQRVTNYAEFFDTGGWDSVSSELPGLLFVGESGATERRLQRLVRSAVRNSELDDIQIHTSTYGAVEHLEGEGEIWTSLEDREDLRALPDMIYLSEQNG